MEAGRAARLERRGLMQRVIRSFVLALVLLVLAAGAAHARPLAARSAPVGFFEVLWQWVAPFLPSWVKAGSDMDPDGYTTKAGSEMDPNGTPHNLLAPLPTTDAGGDMDPNGRQ
jgi:hypothetical protein